MGEIVMIIGKSGAGKSTSLRNFKDCEIGILNVAGKRLPFRGNLTTVNRPSYDVCEAALRGNDFKAYAIDDSTYLMQFDYFNRAKEKGFDKFVEMGDSFRQLLMTALSETDDNTLIYFLHHYDFDDEGSMKPQTVGKMLDKSLCVEGLFPIVIEATKRDGKYGFVTKSNEKNSIVKTPMSMFEDEFIDNDLKAVDTTIREYFGMEPLNSKVKSSTVVASTGGK